MSAAPHQRLYYMGNEYMAESASLSGDKYSMKFDQASNSKDPFEQSRKQQQAVTSQKQNEQPAEPQPKRLGPAVFNRIRERYRDQNKLDTEDPDILYGFFMAHRKQKSANPAFEKEAEKLKVAMQRAEKVDPAVQRKILSKLEFDRYLDYEPRDIYYTLVIEKKKLDEDRKLQQQVDKLNQRPEQKKTKRATKEMIERLFDPQGHAQKKNQEKLDKSLERSQRSLSGKKRKSVSPQHKPDKIMEFGKQLVNLYRDRTHTVGTINVDTLYNFWMGVQDKDENGLRLAASEVKPAIEKYMAKMVNNLRMAHHSNKGFDTVEENTLLKFLNSCQKNILDRFQVSIPQEGFKAYLEEYNKDILQKKKQKEEHLKKQQEKQKEEQNKMTRTAMTRPASATPLDILAQPKNSHISEAIELIKQYPHDKQLKEFLKTRMHPIARRPEEYGVYQPQEQIKRKQWVKAEKNNNPQRIIQNMVFTSTLKGFDVGAAPAFTSAAVKKIFEEDYLEDQEKWTGMKDDLKRQLKILAYKLAWCRNALLSFCEQQMSKPSAELEYKDDNTLIDEIIDYITKLPQSSRKSKLAYLSHDINMHEAKSKFENQNKQIEDNPEQEAKQKRKFYWFLENKAKEYVKTYLSEGAVAGTESRTAALIAAYEAAKSQHPTYVQKSFPVVASQAHHACPPSFKHQFFRIVKEINPYTVEKKAKPKSHIWAPTGTKSDSINQHTFNRVVKAYSRDKNVLKEQQKKEGRDPSPPPKKGAPRPSTAATVWTKDKTDERLKFLMTYDEARECTFKPIVHKAVM